MMSARCPTAHPYHYLPAAWLFQVEDMERMAYTILRNPVLKELKFNSSLGSPASDDAYSAEVYTDANGRYTIPGLGSGSSCVYIDANTSPNDSILPPGNWTYPILMGIQ